MESFQTLKALKELDLLPSDKKKLAQTLESGVFTVPDLRSLSGGFVNLFISEPRFMTTHKTGVYKLVILSSKESVTIYKLAEKRTFGEPEYELTFLYTFQSHELVDFIFMALNMFTGYSMKEENGETALSIQRLVDQLPELQKGLKEVLKDKVKT